MSFNHQISDLVVRIKNGASANKEVVLSPVSKLRESILSILKKEGYILNYTRTKNDSSSAQQKFEIHLKYHDFISVISEIDVISKPGRRIYSSKSNIPIVKNGLGAVIMSTSKGIMTDNNAIINGVGGELLLKIF